MAISDLTEKILSETQEEKALLVQQANAEAMRMAQETEKEIAILKQEAERSLENTLVEAERKLASSAKQEAKTIIDSTKRTLLDEVFENAFKRLVTLDAPAYKEVLARHIKNVSSLKNGSVLAPQNRVKETKEVFTEAGIDTEVTPTNDFRGGFIFVGDTYEYNATFEKITEDKKKVLEIEVAQILFGSK